MRSAAGVHEGIGGLGLADNGSDHSPAKITCTVAAGLTVRAPVRKEIDVYQDDADRLGGDEAKLARFLDAAPAATPSM